MVRSRALDWGWLVVRLLGRWPLLLFVGGSGLFFGGLLVLGLTPYEDDIENYHYPVLVLLLQALRQGQLPLWTPAMFVGFPFLADGSAGTFYPLNWLALLVPADRAVVWLLWLRTLLSGLFFFLFLRAVGRSPAAATFGAFVYAFSGYSVGHWIHFSIGHSALTLPLALWAIERACQTRGRAAGRWLVVAGLAHGLQWLGLHPQVALISAVGLLAYGVFRGLEASSGLSWPQRGLRLGRGMGLVGLIAAGLAAAQLVPMAELGRLSERGQGVSYAFATSHALPPHNLLTALWPFLFVAPGGFDWGLTTRWETAFYVGQVPLGLALVAVVVRRDRWVLFWGTMALVSLWVALGSYAPLNLHYLVYSLPPFAPFRVPARFLQLTDLALAVLAATGFDLLRRAPAVSLRAGIWTFAAPVLLLILLGWATVALVTLAPAMAQSLLDTLYGHWPHANPWHADRLWPALQQTLSPQNRRWLLWSGLALLSAVLLLAAHRRPQWPFWPLVLAGLAVLDLLLFARAFWHLVPTTYLSQPADPLARYLLDHATGQRVWNLPGVPTRPNRLLAWGIREVEAYGPLRPQRFVAYSVTAQRGESRLLDLLGVRWVVAPLPERAPAHTAGVFFDPHRAEVVVGRRWDLPPPLYQLAEPVPVQRVRLVGALAYAAHLAQGTTVAEVVLRRPEGQTTVLPLQAGVHLAEWAAERPDVWPSLRHALPTVVWREPVFDPHGWRFDRLLFFGEVTLPEPWPVAQVSLHLVEPSVVVEVYGLSLVTPAGTVRPLDRFDHGRFRERLRTAAGRVLENQQALPRVFLVGAARRLPPDQAGLDRLARELADPLSVAYLEEPVDLPAQPAGPAGTARLVAETPTGLVIAVAASRPALLVVTDLDYPGWQATVDGLPAPIYRANYLFRAVPVPPGAHTVVMRFDPLSVRVGLAASLLTLLGALVLLRAWRPRRVSAGVAGDNVPGERPEPGQTEKVPV